MNMLMSTLLPMYASLMRWQIGFFQSEYVADRDRRREFVSGFTDSARLALIIRNEALLWTDGRYFLQVTQQ